MPLDEFAEQRRSVFAEHAVVGTEGGEEVRVDVEFAGDLAMDENGNDDFGFGLERTSEIARVGVDIVDDNGFAGGGRCAADALIEGDARVGSHRALERAEDEDVVIPFFFEHVKTNPVVAREFFVEERNDTLHEASVVVDDIGEAYQDLGSDQLICCAWWSWSVVDHKGPLDGNARSSSR